MKPQIVSQFGEWLPDLPDLNNPGATEIKNCQPIDRVYKPFYGLTKDTGALTARCQGALSAKDQDGNVVTYAGDATKLYRRASATSWNDRSGATYTTSATQQWKFAQYESTIIATNFADVPQSVDVDSPASNFAALGGSPPRGKHIGVIRDFVMLGDIDDGTHKSYAVRWSAIGDPTDWPTPATDDAASKQSGEESLNPLYGRVMGIANGEQFGIVFQEHAINRFTYVGGSVVFQIQAFERSRGLFAPKGMQQIGRHVYFLDESGFYVTDGYKVEPIGDGKVDRWFLDDFDAAYPDRLTTGVDLVNKLIYWSYPGSGNSSGAPNKILIFNYEEGRWSNAEIDTDLVFTAKSPGYTLDELDSISASIDSLSASLDSSIWAGGTSLVGAFSNDYKFSTFTGAALAATIETPELNLNQGGRAFVSGVKPLIEGSGSTIQAFIGSRANQQSVNAYGSAVSPETRSSICHFRSDNYYHRAKVTVSGGFDRALGAEFHIRQAGYV